MNMTTELAQRGMAQREKFETWLEEAEALPWGYLKKRRTSDSAYRDPNTTDMWDAWQAASAELIEALEARDKQIAKDVQIKARLCRESNSLHDRLREAEKRIAELEARTVKLPAEKFCPAEYIGSQLWSEAEAWNKAITACADAIRAAGVAVEGE